VEEYVARFPELDRDSSRLLDLVYHEYLLRRQCLGNASPDDLLQRFPELETELRRQIQFSEALESMSNENDATGTAIGFGPPIAPPAPKPAARPSQLGRYQLDRRLGSGAMGDVFVALDTELQRQVAIKVPKNTNSYNPGQQSRILCEARALASLNHPYVCPIYDFGSVGEIQYIVMPLLQGSTLAEYLRQHGPLSTEVSIGLMRKIAEAVKAVHGLQIAHRDLKPGNIMLDSRLEPMVLDFGLVQSDRDDTRLTNPGMIVGSPAYLAPEKLAGERGDVYRADLYSLGVIFYEMLTGRRPFEGQTAMQLLTNAITKDVPPPQQWVADIPYEVEAVCLKALARSPENRFPSVAAFLQALEQLPAGKIADVPGAPATESAASGPHRRSRVDSRWWYGMIVGAVLIVATALLVSRYNAQPTTRVGDVWEGSFQFVNNSIQGTVELEILSVSGKTFTAKYRTELGEYVWSAHGETTDRGFEFRLIEALSPKAADMGVAGQARVVGEVTGSHFRGTYTDSDSQASMVMDRRRTK
jgi:serine/threonine-protein kinase